MSVKELISMLEKGYFSLKDFAFETDEDKIINIPTVQRGLVWRPKQVELLWDSILRGFPIGGFIVSENKDLNKFDLMDGQQRYNAISLGFRGNEDSKLWIDLDPQEKQNSTRKFWIKVITKAHPWGYMNSDDCYQLTASERRYAMEQFGYSEKTLYEADLKLDNCWPIKAQMPVPLSALLDNANAPSVEDFVTKSIDAIKIQMSNTRYKEFDESILKEKLGFFYDDANLSKLFDYRITFSVFLKDALDNIEKDTVELENSKSEIEILFERIGTGGTQISQTELNYSAMKVYWEKDVIEKIESIAKDYAPAHIFANIVFRFFEIQKEEKWTRSVSIQAIRKCALANESKTKMSKFVSEKLEDIVGKAKNWLVETENFGFPSVLLTDIVISYPDIFILLLWFASRNSDLDGKYIIALALFLEWFTSDNVQCAESIFLSCQNEVSKKNIEKALLDCRIKYYVEILFPCEPNELRNMIPSFDSFNKDWKVWNLSSSKYKIFECLNYRIGKNLLLYAERKFLKEHFSKYNPARSDMWEDHNRPWDFDHILPQNWLYNRSGIWKPFSDQWLNSPGNLAAIPFEVNRSKNCSDEYGYYKENAELLYFDKNNDYSALYDIKDNEEHAKLFAKYTFDRLIAIYADLFDLLKELFSGENCDFTKNDVPNSICKKRFEFLASIKKELSDAGIETEVRYVNNENKESKITDYKDWSYPSISLEADFNENAVIAITLNGDNKEIEIGIRKSPNSENINKDLLEKIQVIETDFGWDSSWWYACREMPFEDTKKDEVLEKFKELIRFRDSLILSNF